MQIGSECKVHQRYFTIKKSKKNFSIREDENGINLENLPKKTNSDQSSQNESNKDSTVPRCYSPETFPCHFSGCNKNYKTLYRLKVHLRIHENAKPFICTICFKSFNEKGNLKTHLLIHSGEKPYKCDFINCQKKFRTFGHLKDHMSTHLNLRIFQCKKCGESFARNWTLKKHILTHTGERPFSCKFCFKKFADKSNLTTHIKRHGNPFNIYNEKNKLKTKIRFEVSNKNCNDPGPETPSSINFSTEEKDLINIPSNFTNVLNRTDILEQNAYFQEIEFNMLNYEHSFDKVKLMDEVFHFIYTE